MSTRAKYNRPWPIRVAAFLVRPFLGQSRGAGFVEYLLLMGLCAIGLITAFQRFRARSNIEVRNQSKSVMALDAPDPRQVIADLGGYEVYDDTLDCKGGYCTWPGSCFAAGTVVATETGDRPIEQIRVGELVWSRNETTGMVGLHAVKRLFRTPDRYVVDLKLGHDLLQTETITVTPNHPFWVEGKGWTAADDLSSSTGWSPEGPLSLSTAFERTETTTVYNLEIEGDHTYFVGHSHALVHNAPPKKCPGTGTGGQPKTKQQIEDCVQKYLAAHPYSMYHDSPAAEQVLRDRCTNEDYNDKTQQLRDPKAGTYPPPDKTPVPKANCATKTTPTTRGNKQKAQQRQELLCKGQTQDGIDVSYQAGTLASKNYARQNYPASDGWVSTFDEGNNTFDGVLVNTKTGQVIILEAKGGDSGLGTRWAAPGSSSGVRVQQGTKEYIEAVAADMANKTLADTITSALNSHQLRYMVVRQPLNGTCKPAPVGTAGDVQITEYDVGASSTDCPKGN